MNKKNKWKLAAIMLIFSTALTSCATYKLEEKPSPQIPAIQDSAGNIVVIYGDREDEENTQTFKMRIIKNQSDKEAEKPFVAVPLWYWKKIVRYIIDTQS